MQVRKTLSTQAKKKKHVIKQQEINRDGKGNEKLCGKKLHLNDICFNAHSPFSVTETKRYEVIHTVLESNSWCG